MKHMIYWELGFAVFCAIIDPKGCAKEVGSAYRVFREEVTRAPNPAQP